MADSLAGSAAPARPGMVAAPVKHDEGPMDIAKTEPAQLLNTSQLANHLGIAEISLRKWRICGNGAGQPTSHLKGRLARAATTPENCRGSSTRSNSGIRASHSSRTIAISVLAR